MALVTERFATVRDGWLTVDITYDDASLLIERILVQANGNPNPIHFEILRGGSPNPWREGDLEDGFVYDETRPFGGGFRDLDDIAGLAIRLEF